MSAVEERFWAKVDRSGVNGCWEWTASRNSGGYGKFLLDGRLRAAHRVAYEWLVGQIPEGLDLDHLCRNRRCVNPEHLEPVSRRENSLRGASPTIAVYLSGVAMCGHELTPENTTWEEGHRRCRTCRRATNKAARERRKQRGGPSFVVPLAPTCGKGHEYTPENTYIQPSTGGRACRECRRLGRSREVGRRRG